MSQTTLTIDSIEIKATLTPKAGKVITLDVITVYFQRNSETFSQARPINLLELRTTKLDTNINWLDLTNFSIKLEYMIYDMTTTIVADSCTVMKASWGGDDNELYIHIHTEPKISIGPLVPTETPQQAYERAMSIIK